MAGLGNLHFETACQVILMHKVWGTPLFTGGIHFDLLSAKMEASPKKGFGPGSAFAEPPLHCLKAVGKWNKSLSHPESDLKLGASVQRSCGNDPPRSLHSLRREKLTCSKQHDHGRATLLSSYLLHRYEFQRTWIELHQFGTEAALYWKSLALPCYRKLWGRKSPFPSCSLLEVHIFEFSECLTNSHTHSDRFYLYLPLTWLPISLETSITETVACPLIYPFVGSVRSRGGEKPHQAHSLHWGDMM